MRKGLLVILAAAAVLVATWQHPGPAQGVGGTIFPLSISGTSWQPQVYGLPGKPLGNGKVNDKAIKGVLQGTLDDFAKDYLPLDPSGQVFLYFDGLTGWRIGTNSSGSNLVPLSGRVANDGTFWMMGDYNFGTMGTIFVSGKVKFLKGTFDPKSVSGTFYFFSETINTGLILKFKTKKPLV
ncbi:MAG TPA: hypothetical protein VFD92_06700 [Candidatus Binatia bacterium]|nr:hypothetical protein [Candidatus Binatia bacterium]